MESSDDAIIGIDLEGTILSWNPGAERLYEYAGEEAVGRPISMLVPPDRPSEVPSILERLKRDERINPFETIRVCKAGKRVEVSVSVSPIKDPLGRVRAASSIERDVTERKEAQRALEHQALHDALTGLPNRTLFHDRVQQAIRVGHREKRPAAVMIMDLDRFKEVNDTMGHHNGDIVLCEIAKRLQSTLRESDTIARLGGDEFAVLLPTVPETAGADQVASKLLKALEQPFTLDGLALDVSGSIGISLYPEHGEDATALMQRADVAMYAAKQARAGYEVYASANDPYTANRLKLMTELRRAIEGEGLVLHYQPKIDLRSGMVTGVEALVRWRHPRHGLLAPDKFIPLAEHTGLIKPLTLHLLEVALVQCRAWHGAGLDLSVALNLSVRNLLDRQFTEQVARRLSQWSVAPGWIELEITENAIMADPVCAKAVLSQLNDMGIKLAVDDFGTGYSSLSYLMQLPVDQIKIDKSFVIDMAKDENAAVIVRSIIDLARNLHLQVVAEGVETKPICEQLATLGCELAQGYYIARPMAATDLPAWLQDWSSNRKKAVA